jgi:hypothetical protein
VRDIQERSKASFLPCVRVSMRFAPALWPKAKGK